MFLYLATSLNAIKGYSISNANQRQSIVWLIHSPSYSITKPAVILCSAVAGGSGRRMLILGLAHLAVGHTWTEAGDSAVGATLRCGSVLSLRTERKQDIRARMSHYHHQMSHKWRKWWKMEGWISPNIIGKLFFMSIPVTFEDEKPYNDQNDHNEQ